MKHSRFAIIAVAVVVLVSFATLAVAQSGDERRAIFEAAQKLPTSVGQAQIFAAPPKGFNPLTASHQELWQYGLPEAPDKDSNPIGYQKWAKAMLALKTRATDVRATKQYSMNAQQTGHPKTRNADGSTNVNYYNWSGIANTNELAKWNSNTSFDEVVSYWNAPVANPPFGSPSCSDGPWYEVTWNGIDGYSNGDVVQGGSAIYWDGGSCGGSAQYFGWVEWYPSYPILEIDCATNTPCPVSPGDDFFAVTYGAPGTDTQSVFVEDITQQWNATVSLPYVTGPGLVGQSAEYIVERPCCVGSHNYPLANYIFEFMGYNYAYDGAGTLFYPGSTSAATTVISMVDDSDSQDISTPLIYGSSGSAGKFSIMLEDDNCAYSGGCTE